jgi:hypothetical protein
LSQNGAACGGGVFRAADGWQGERMSETVPTVAQSGPTKKRKRSTDWSAIAFVASLCLLSFIYGTASSEFELPPNQQLRQAFTAFKAFSGLESDDLPTGVNWIDRQAKPDPLVRQLDPTAGKELLLVTGGTNEDALHCPKFGCLAWIIDRSGKVLHSWPLPLDTLFNGVQGYSGDVKLTNFYPIGLALLHDGSLIATFHSRNTYPYDAGIARIDWNGKVLWSHVDGAHHWPHIGADGRIYSPFQIRRKMEHVAGNAVPRRCSSVIYDAGLRIYRPDGTVERTVMIAEMLVKNDYPGLIYSVRDYCDPLHINSVDVATAEVAKHIPGAAAGDVLISLREPSAILLFDPVTATIKRLIAGRTAAQHSAKFLPNGTIIAFDNQGGFTSLGGSRIVRLNLVDGSAQTLFPTQASRPVLPFFSENGGTVTPSPDGRRAMISSKLEARDIEFDLATGRPLWTRTNVHDAAPFMKGSKAPLAGYFVAHGTYYLDGDLARSLRLNGSNAATAKLGASRKTEVTD